MKLDGGLSTSHVWLPEGKQWMRFAKPRIGGDTVGHEGGLIDLERHEEIHLEVGLLIYG